MGESEDRKIRVERKAVVERMVRSKAFAGKGKRIALLRALFENDSTRLSGRTLAGEMSEDATKRANKGAPKRKDAKDVTYNEVNFRQLCMELRQSITKYSEGDASEDLWRCYLPLVKGNEGYKLEWTSILEEEGAVQCFWQAHLGQPVVVVYNEPLFLRDVSQKIIIRVMTEDSEASIENSISALKGILTEEARASLTPSHPYVLSGEVGARECITDWFRTHHGVRVASKLTRQMVNISDIASCCPILLGNSRTNKIVKAAMKLFQHSRFGYYVEGRGFRTLEVRRDDKKHGGEWEKLKEFVKPKDNRKDSFVLRDDPTPDKMVFGTVTRMPNIYDKERAAMTIISASYSRVLEAIADTLTTEAEMRKAFATANIPLDRPFPRYFQGLFSIRLGPSGAEDQCPKPELLCARAFQNFKDE